jgi:hypothetical protein
MADKRFMKIIGGVGNQINAHNLCLFEDLPTNIQQGKDRQIDILREAISRSVVIEGLGAGLLLTCRNEIRAIEMPEYR